MTVEVVIALLSVFTCGVVAGLVLAGWAERRVKADVVSWRALQAVQQEAAQRSSHWLTNQTQSAEPGQITGAPQAALPSGGSAGPIDASTSGSTGAKHCRRRVAVRAELMSDDLFVLCVYVAGFAVVMSVGYGLTAIMFDKDGYWRWRKR